MQDDPILLTIIIVVVVLVILAMIVITTIRKGRKYQADIQDIIVRSVNNAHVQNVIDQLDSLSEDFREIKK